MPEDFENVARETKIKLVAEYIMETGSSYRETAKYFSEKKLKISHVTVKDYCDKYIEFFPENGASLQDVINGNKPKGINDETVKMRVLMVARIYTSSDFSVEEIADNLEITSWTVYRDLMLRLPMIDTDEARILYEKVKEKSEENSISNLRNQNGR